MNPGWQFHLNVWRHAVFGERRGAVLAWTAVAFAICALFTLTFMAIEAAMPRKGMLLIAMPLVALGAFHWMRYLSGAMRQNTPANARLVPGLCHSVRRTTVLAWCLTLLPMALFASAFEHSALAFIAMSAMVTAQGMSRGGHGLGTGIYVVLVFFVIVVTNRPDLIELLSSAPMLVALALLSLAFGWHALFAVFPSGGERHFKLLPGQDKQRAGGDLHSLMKVKRSSGGRARLYSALLKHDLDKADPQHLLLHALGPHNHRFDFAAPLLIAVLAAVAARLALPAAGYVDMQVPLAIIYSCAVPLLLLQGFTFHRTVVSMDNTRGEQALVKLAPGSPPANLLGRVLARQLFAICLTEWFVAGMAVLGLMLLFGADAKGLRMMASLMCISLAMTGWTLRDYSGKRPGSLFVVTAQTMAMGAACIGLIVLFDRPMAWGALIAIVLASTLLILRGRWQSMVEAPAPFPAGRFA